MKRVTIALVSVVTLILWAATARAQAPDGAAVFEKACASCHANPAADSRAPNRAALAQLAPETILTALTTGNMFRQGSALTDADRRAVSAFLTGRAVGADEALQMGLVNRVVETGTALHAAVELAEQLCEFPQACMRSDRLSSLEQWELSDTDAIENEFARGSATIRSGETVSGAARFSSGEGRHGEFKKS